MLLWESEIFLLLIYCAGGNPVLTRIAHEEGWALGVRSDVWHLDMPLAFVDIDYKKPNFERHMARVAKEQPILATVPDLSDKEVSESDIERVVMQAERLKDYCKYPLIVPKLPGQIALIPATIAIGYSIPSSYGGAQYPIWELSGRKVHLLGGSPQKQLEAYRYVNAIGEVIAADGNYAQKMATKFLEYFDRPGKYAWKKWPDLGKNQYPACWRQSCRNIYQMWLKEGALNVQAA